jgi:hypothetical protein
VPCNALAAFSREMQLHHRDRRQTDESEQHEKDVLSGGFLFSLVIQFEGS